MRLGQDSASVFLPDSLTTVHPWSSRSNGSGRSAVWRMLSVLGALRKTNNEPEQWLRGWIDPAERRNSAIPSSNGRDQHTGRDPPILRPVLSTSERGLGVAGEEIANQGEAIRGGREGTGGDKMALPTFHHTPGPCCYAQLEGRDAQGPYGCDLADVVFYGKRDWPSASWRLFAPPATR